MTDRVEELVRDNPQQENRRAASDECELLISDFAVEVEIAHAAVNLKRNIVPPVDLSRCASNAKEEGKSILVFLNENRNNKIAIKGVKDAFGKALVTDGVEKIKARLLACATAMLNHIKTWDAEAVLAGRAVMPTAVRDPEPAAMLMMMNVAASDAKPKTPDGGLKMKYFTPEQRQSICAVRMAGIILQAHGTPLLPSDKPMPDIPDAVK